MQKIGNFSVSAIETMFESEGYFDVYNFDDTGILANNALTSRRRWGASSDATKTRYEFEFSPVNGFLANPDLLMTDCELKLSFDRASLKNAFIRLDGDESLTDLEIKDCYALTEYVSSKSIQSYFEKISYEPITYQYEETEVVIKTLPSDGTTIRLDNIRGGNTPKYLFAGVIPSKNLQGDWADSSTSFKQHNVIEFNIALNGNPVNGYPIAIKKNSPCYALSKFNAVTSRLYNVFAGQQMNMQSFQYNFIWSQI